MKNYKTTTQRLHFCLALYEHSAQWNQMMSSLEVWVSMTYFFKSDFCLALYEHCAHWNQSMASLEACVIMCFFRTPFHLLLNEHFAHWYLFTGRMCHHVPVQSNFPFAFKWTLCTLKPIDVFTGSVGLSVFSNSTSFCSYTNTPHTETNRFLHWKHGSVCGFSSSTSVWSYMNTLDTETNWCLHWKYGLAWRVFSNATSVWPYMNSSPFF